MSAISHWASKLPPRWQALPLKAVGSYIVSNVDKVSVEGELPVRLCNYTDVYKNDFITPEMPLMQTTATQREIAKFRLKQGDVVITKDSETPDDIAVPAYVAKSADDLVCGYHLAILRGGERVRGRFLFRCLQSKAIRVQLELAANGITRYGFGSEAIGRLLLPVPSVAEQDRIADFLDRETARVDGMIGKKMELLRLLEEKRASLISHAVTRGLDPAAKLRDSGIPWLGKIPAHWKVTRLKRLAVKIKTGGTPSRAYMENEADGTIDWFTPSDFTGAGELADSKRKITEEAMRDGEAPMFPRNTVFVVGIGATLGKVGRSKNPASANQQINAVIPRAGVDASFLTYALTSQAAQMRALANSSTLPILNQEATGDVAIAAPSADEQRAIVSHVNRVMEKLAALFQRITESIALLREHRTALISAAVTGKIDVRNS